MEHLAEKLPGRMLSAAIRDVRSRIARLEWDVHATWKSLFRVVEDARLWNALVEQKDSHYSSTLTTSTSRLQRRFVRLFARGIPNDPYCAATAPIVDSTARTVAHAFRNRSDGGHQVPEAASSQPLLPITPDASPAPSDAANRVANRMFTLVSGDASSSTDSWYTPPQSIPSWNLDTVSVLTNPDISNYSASTSSVDNPDLNLAFVGTPGTDSLDSSALGPITNPDFLDSSALGPIENPDQHSLDGSIPGLQWRSDSSDTEDSFLVAMETRSRRHATSIHARSG